ncbi:MAG: hypothetical protein ABW098_10835 [Candidatus Thiodiazotropha sp.]
MKVKKIVRLLGGFLKQGKRPSRHDLDAIDELLKRLQARQDQLQHKLHKEKKTCKQKRFKAELKIVEMKLKKARKRRMAFAKDK